MTRYNEQGVDDSGTQDAAYRAGLDSVAEQRSADEAGGVEQPIPPAEPAESPRQEWPQAGSIESHLLPEPQARRFREEWQSVQSTFVDDPERAVQGADQLVGEVMQALAAGFTAQKQRLEGQWRHGGEVATEELRVALQNYRGFLDQLLDA